MSKPIYFISTITKKCPFSKQIIKPKTTLCIFTKNQFKNFEKHIFKLLSNILPLELIEKIIKFTRYEKLINKVGLEKFTNWIPDYYLSVKIEKELNNKKLLLFDSSSENSDSDSSSDNDY